MVMSIVDASVYTVYQMDTVTWQEVSKHTQPKDCWIVIEGAVYNVSDFLIEHPGGDQVLMRYSGLDATEPFRQAKHSDYAVSLRNARKIGVIESAEYPPGYYQQLTKRKGLNDQPARKTAADSQTAGLAYLSRAIVKKHSSEEDCWIIIDDKVYDVTSFLSQHPGGLSSIMQFAGSNATKAFTGVGHSVSAINKKSEFYIGRIRKNPDIFCFVSVAVVLFAITSLICLYL